MARKGAMAKNPPLRGEARKEFRQAQREAIAAGQPVPSQDKFRQPMQNLPRPQVRPEATSFNLPQPTQDISSTVQAVANGLPTPQQRQMPDVNSPQYQQMLQSYQQMQPQQPSDKMFRFPQMPQPSANQGGKYRLSPGVYGSKEQAMQQFNQQGIQDGMYRSPGVSPNQAPGMSAVWTSKG